MKRRQTKKLLKAALQQHVAAKQPTVAELYGKVNELVHRANSETKYCVFLHYSGHVNSFEMYITSTKQSYLDRVAEEEVSFNEARYYRGESPAQKLQAMIDSLQHILDTGSLNGLGTYTYPIEEQRYSLT